MGELIGGSQREERYEVIQQRYEESMNCPTLFYAKLHVLLFSSDYICYADDFIFVGALSIAELLRWDCLLSHMSGTSTCGATGL